MSNEETKRPLPIGYRQGVITTITVFLGFSLSFLRYWAFEAAGEWTPRSIGALVIMLIPIFAQINTLYRALLVADDNESTYRITILWFVWSVRACYLPFALPPSSSQGCLSQRADHHAD